MSAANTPPIALALSGGGIRAMAFHLGVLKFMAERSLLERVQRVSTVSGGSLLVGLLLKEQSMRWPSSASFLSDVYPALRTKLCQRSLQWGAARQLADPRNWKYLLSRANLLGLALRKEWDIDHMLADLPAVPEWSINGTTAENGKRFRFKRDNMGDYTLGYAASNQFPLADALAVSAAFPGGFGPLRIEAQRFEWRKRGWNAPAESERTINIGEAIHLYDGGVYDNLGLEPFFDAGKGVSKHADTAIWVSDAGSPLPHGFAFGSLNPGRLKRVADIMSDQSHALRVRTFAHYIQQASKRGAFFFIGTPTANAGECEFASAFPTTLRKLALEDFNRLAHHGYSVTEQFDKQYGPIAAPSSRQDCFA